MESKFSEIITCAKFINFVAIGPTISVKRCTGDYSVPRNVFAFYPVSLQHLSNAPFFLFLADTTSGVLG